MNKEHLHPDGRPYTQEEFVEKIKTDKSFSKRFGNLGKIYGYQWRNWNGEIDQISELIRQLKEEPDSRRMVVSAWAVHDLPNMVLPPCHYGFQVYTRELSYDQRFEIFILKNERKFDWTPDKKITSDVLDELNIPSRAISLMWNQRSVDTFLGLPFNIASYGLLLEIIAKEVNMVPDELIGNLGDVHLYLNHVEQAKEQIGREMTWEEQVQWVMKNTDVEMENLSIVEEIAKDSTPQYTREPYPLPTLKIEDGFDIVSGLDDIYEINSFTLENYQSHPTIKAPLSN